MYTFEIFFKDLVRTYKDITTAIVMNDGILTEITGEKMLSYHFDLEDDKIILKSASGNYSIFNHELRCIEITKQN